MWKHVYDGPNRCPRWMLNVKRSSYYAELEGVAEETTETEETIVEVQENAEEASATQPAEVPASEIKIDYERGVVTLMQGGETIVEAPINERLVGKYHDAIMQELWEKIDLDRVGKKSVGYRCACHHTKSNTCGLLHCNVCGTYADIPIYKGEEDG